MLRILLFSPKGAGHHYYGPGMNAYRMYQNVDPSMNISISLAHGNRDQEEYQVFNDQYFISDIVNKDLYLGVKFLFKAKKWVKENAHKFDVVHCLTAFHHSFMFSYWFEQEGIPVIIKIGQSNYTGFQDNSIFSKVLGLSRFRNKHANEITGYVSISKRIKKNLLKAGIEERRIHSIPNGVDVEIFKPVDSKTKRQIKEKLGLLDKFTVLFTGAFSGRKNPLLIAKSFEKFKNESGIQLLLIGPNTDDGQQRRQIEQLIQEKKISNIFIKDFVKDIADYYKASDLFVLPSKEEGLSNSMLEAMASGLPAVVTKISGSEDLIDESVNGRFIELDSSSIYKAIDDYYKNKQKWSAHSNGARATILEKYDSKSVLNDYIELFRNIHHLN